MNVPSSAFGMTARAEMPWYVGEGLPTALMATLTVTFPGAWPSIVSVPIHALAGNEFDGEARDVLIDEYPRECG